MTDIIEAMKDALHLLHDEIVAKEEQIEDLKRQLAERDTKIADLRDQLAERNVEIANRVLQLHDRDDLIADLRADLAAAMADNEILKAGLVGSYDLDAWLDWAKEAKHLRADNERLREALTATRWTAMHDCHLEQTIERVVKLRNDIIGIAYKALAQGGDPTEEPEQGEE